MFSVLVCLSVGIIVWSFVLFVVWFGVFVGSWLTCVLFICLWDHFGCCVIWATFIRPFVHAFARVCGC